MSVWPVLDLSKCNGCGICVTVCLNGSLIVEENVIQLIEAGECDWCGECEAVCPTGAICCPYEIILDE